MSSNSIITNPRMNIFVSRSTPNIFLAMYGNDCVPSPFPSQSCRFFNLPTELRLMICAHLPCNLTRTKVDLELPPKTFKLAPPRNHAQLPFVTVWPRNEVLLTCREIYLEAHRLLRYQCIRARHTGLHDGGERARDALGIHVEVTGRQQHLDTLGDFHSNPAAALAAWSLGTTLAPLPRRARKRLSGVLFFLHHFYDNNDLPPSPHGVHFPLS